MIAHSILTLLSLLLWSLVAKGMPALIVGTNGFEPSWPPWEGSGYVAVWTDRAPLWDGVGFQRIGCLNRDGNYVVADSGVPASQPAFECAIFLGLHRGPNVGAQLVSLSAHASQACMVKQSTNSLDCTLAHKPDNGYISADLPIEDVNIMRDLWVYEQASSKSSTQEPSPIYMSDKGTADNPFTLVQLVWEALL